MTRMDMAAVISALRRMEKICFQSEREELPPAAQWLRDNARMLYSEALWAKDSRREYKKAAYKPLYAFCKQLLMDNTGRVHEGILYHAAQKRQQEQPFTVRELRALRDMLRIVLMEMLQEMLLQAEKECRAYQQGEALAAQLAQGDAVQKAPEDAVLLSRAMEVLTESGDMLSARALEALMRGQEWQLSEVLRLSQERCMRTAGQTSAVITSLRRLGKINFGRLTERLSVSCQLLLQEGTFRRMDAGSRALYLTAVERLSRRSGEKEERICEKALQLAGENEGAAGESGYYLLEKPELLLQSLGCKAGLGRRHAAAIYGGMMALGAVAFGALGIFLLPWWGVLPFMLVGVQLSQRLAQRLFLRVLPPYRLPRLQGREMRRAGRCLVAVPTLLMDRQHALRMVRQLSVLYLANKGAALDFMLLSDFADADGETSPQDEEILSALRMGIQALNDAYGERFLALHRARTWDEGAGKYIGSERKRGAILTLCRLLLGEKTAERMVYASVAPETLKDRYRYVITLDADTFLPSGAAEKMILTMMHPLQQGRRAVLQPRMATLPMHVTTWAQKLLGGLSGADGYDSAANDFYQDVFQRGSFMGKGILEPRAFLQATEQLPGGKILSHDLIEGELAGSALMSDIVCFDGHPRTVEGFLKRAHRWTRGDWQLLSVLRMKALDPLSKWKIIDNLRRSLLPVMRVAALLAAAYSGAYLPFALALLPWENIADWALLSASACTQLDAIARAVYRLTISRKKLLEWTTAAQADRSELHSLRETLLPMLPGALMVFAAAYGVFVPGFLLGALWMSYPLWKQLLNAPWHKKTEAPPEDRAFLMEVARDTLRFFREHVDEKTHYLPPDNVQLSPPRGAAMRTSPTNIGMYLLSLCAARKLQLLDSDEMLTAMRNTVQTLEKLEKWHGNLYNWYDLNTLAPLPPRFVSSVDAGNCHICLLAAAQCARRYMHEGDASVRDVPRRLDALCRDMRLNRLYDKHEDLFYIGYDADRGEMTEGHYDLMASEALLLSFTAIAAGQVNEKHWWRLGRAFTRARGGNTLLSWSGTMFEYLLPALLLPAFPGSMLHAAQRACVKTQLKCAQEWPLGVSESGYAQFDEQLHYAYRAFGLAELSLSGQCQEGVRAPYAAALALLTHPKEATAALRDWKARGVYGAHGFFEAEDFVTDEIPHIVCSHMAHHQGMILCAVCNALCEENLTTLLFSLPRMRAHLPMLCELPPRRVLSLPRPLQAHRDAKEISPLQLRARKCVPPDVHVLSGGGLTMVQSALGQGYLAQDEVLLTRFEQSVSKLSGLQFYLHIVKENASVRLTGGEYLFREGEWRARSAAGAVRASVSGCVDPITGAAVYRVKARNLSDTALRTELTMYLEPVLEILKKDEAHRAFSSLFVSVEQTGVREVTIRRRLREGGERKMRLRALTAGSGQTLITNDRALFIGRTGTMEAPDGLRLPDSMFVLRPVSEPCCALRVPWVLPSGHEETLYFALGMGDLPDNDEQAARAFSLCAARAQVMQRMLRADARQLTLLCRLAGGFLFENLPGKEKAITSVRDLWPQGVSGDKPFALVEIGDIQGEATLRQTLRLLALLFEHGMTGEALLLLPEENNYEQPLRVLCESQLMRPALRALRGRARIVFDTDERFARAARALCAVRIDCMRDLRTQLQTEEMPQTVLWAQEDGQLPSIGRLTAFNGYGGFTQEGGYTVLPAAHGGTLAPWSYMICNERFGTLLCEQGILYSHAGNARLRRITKNHQDSVQITPSEEYILLENGRALSFTKAGAPGESYRVTYETGTALYEHAAQGLQLSLHCCTDTKWSAGLRLLTVRNLKKEERALTLRATAHLALGEEGRGTMIEMQGDQLLARSGEMPGCAVFAMAGAQAINESTLQLEFLLRAGETKEMTVLLGYCGVEDQRPLLRGLLAHGRDTLRRARGAWDERLRKMQFFLPDETLSLYFNAFLPYQIRASRLEMRAGFYQSGGAYGFRDQLQDMLPLVYTEPERVRAHLLLCASRQYCEGDVQHWWHPYGAGVRTRISDDLLFLPYVTARYVYVTGEREILRCHAPYLHSEELRSDEHDRYEMAEVTRETGSLMEHCLRAIDRVRLGAQGLPLMGGGDWNDGMDQVQGESAWLGFFYLMVLRDFAPLCEEKEKRDIERRAQQMEKSLRQTFRDKWFIRAWYQDGRSIGAHDSDVPRIDLISQCFAAFAGMPRNQVLSALDHAWERLHNEKLGITYLMDPPFSPAEKAGYIGAYLPGVRENGGQYTHAVPWFMRALLQYGRKARAWQLLQEILPYNHAWDAASARHYRVEPYALPADVYRWGRGGWTWYTGSAAWLYDVFLRDFLGFDKRGDTVTLRPRVPEGWEECTVLYRFGQSRYQLTASREMRYVTLDGARVRGEYITLTDDGRAHEARFPMGE